MKYFKNSRLKTNQLQRVGYQCLPQELILSSLGASFVLWYKNTKPFLLELMVDSGVCQTYRIWSYWMAGGGMPYMAHQKDLTDKNNLFDLSCTA